VVNSQIQSFVLIFLISLRSQKKQLNTIEVFRNLLKSTNEITAVGTTIHREYIQLIPSQVGEHFHHTILAGGFPSDLES